jgi:hypothetical protein
MLRMRVTAPVFQLPTDGGSVIDEQSRNIWRMSVTALVFQLPTDGGSVMAEQRENM